MSPPLQPSTSNRTSTIAVGPVFLGFAPQGLDRRLTLGFGAGIAGGPPGPRRPDSPNRNRTPAVVERGRKTHLHEVQSIC